MNFNYHNTIVSITTKGKNIPFHILLESNNSNGLTEKSFVKCEQILTISKNRLVKKIGEIDKNLLTKIEKVVKLILDFK